MFISYKMQKLATSIDDLNQFFSINTLVIKKKTRLTMLNLLFYKSEIVNGNKTLKNHVLLIR